METKIKFNPSSLPIATVMNKIKKLYIEGKDGLDLQPSYQRGYVWNESFKEKLIYSIIKGYPIGNISIRDLEEKTKKNATSEVVDGQQRLTTIYNFMNDDLEIKGEYARNIIKEIKIYINSDDDKRVAKLIKKLDIKGNIIIKYSNLPDDIKLDMQSYPLSITNISNASTEQITEYFNFLQNQERLRAGEIINSMPDTYLEKYLDAISDRKKLFQILSYDNNRKEFDKIFYSIIGLFDQKINFGVTDEIIQNYASNKKHEIIGESSKLINNMIRNLNIIIEKSNIGSIKVNKRYIKLLLLLCGFDYIQFEYDTKDKLVKLETVNNKLSSFNSAKKEIVNETFRGREDEIENYRLIALLTKGSHPINRVEERIKMLSSIMNN